MQSSEKVGSEGFVFAERKEALDSLVNDPFGWLIHPHILPLKMLMCHDLRAHRSMPVVTSLKFLFH